MNILDIAKQRFSVRNYLTKEIFTGDIGDNFRSSSCSTNRSKYAAC